MTYDDIQFIKTTLVPMLSISDHDAWQRAAADCLIDLVLSIDLDRPVVDRSAEDSMTGRVWKRIVDAKLATVTESTPYIKRLRPTGVFCWQLSKNRGLVTP